MKPDIHEDEHERLFVIGWRYGDYKNDRIRVIEYEERPIVWPVGCIPIPDEK